MSNSSSELPDGLTIVIAAHNEDQVIESTIRKLNSVFSVLSCKPFEIFVSEDGSSDQTREIVQRLELIYPEVRLSSESVRLGYSKAMARGITEAKFNTICFIDGDGQTEASDLAELLPHLSQNTVVVGFRSPRSDTKARKFQSNVFNLLYVVLGFPKMKDVSAGSIVANTKEILPFAHRHILLEYGFWWEFQAWRERVGLAVVEIPIPHYTRLKGVTQVYRLSRIAKIATTHVVGLLKLRSELNKL